MRNTIEELTRAGAVMSCFALVLGVTPVKAQDTASLRQDSPRSGTVDTSQAGAQNPSGYRAMERPQSSDSTTASDSAAPADATSRINQRRRQDSLAKPGQNPPGYRGMERPVSGESASLQSSDTTGRSAQPVPKKSTRRHHRAKNAAKVQNPAGYRGMERPVNVFPADSSKSAGRSDATSRINQRERQDSLADPSQNPPGFRGMERPAALDSAERQRAHSQTQADSLMPARQDTLRDSTR
jgi:hypothetical protein